jgi:uncharacterized cupredoxin-like copper-binding protein
MKRVELLFIACLFFPGPFVALADERSTTEKLQRMTIRLSEYRFEPSQVVLKTGEEIELTLVNEGTVMHEFITDALKGLEIDVEINGVVAETYGVAELEIPSKAKAVLHFTPVKPGEFSMVCHAKEPKDHFKEGMSGKLVFK